LIGFGGAAASIVRNKQRIAEVFTERVRARLAAARPERAPMIIDTLPAFLTRLALALRPEAGLGFASEYSSIAVQHGLERAQFTDYALGDLIHEYQTLREILVETLVEDDAPDPHDWTVIHRSIDEAMAEAAASFVRVQEEFRERFTAALSHDIRGPLANASNYLELLRRNADPARSEHFVTRALYNLRQIGRLVGEILDLAQATASRGLSLRLQRCEAGTLARDVIDDLRVTHGDRFELYVPAEVHGHWDCDRLKQALHNLLENAVKYGNDGAPISVRVEASEGRLRLSCHNEGAPIPQEILPELFRPFRRALDVASGDKPGWGLGLMLVQSIAAAHGGGVDVESSPRLGTTFTIDVLVDPRQQRKLA
jgi:signal transduction histidine kinase